MALLWQLVKTALVCFGSQMCVTGDPSDLELETCAKVIHPLFEYHNLANHLQTRQGICENVIEILIQDPWSDQQQLKTSASLQS